MSPLFELEGRNSMFCSPLLLVVKKRVFFRRVPLMAKFAHFQYFTAVLISLYMCLRNYYDYSSKLQICYQKIAIEVKYI